MSDEKEGVLVSNADGVFYIPTEQLEGFRLAEGDAESVRAAVGDGDDEVSGFARRLRSDIAIPVKMDFAFSGPRPIKMTTRPGDSIAVEVVANFK